MTTDRPLFSSPLTMTTKRTLLQFARPEVLDPQRKLERLVTGHGEFGRPEFDDPARLSWNCGGRSSSWRNGWATSTRWTFTPAAVSSPTTSRRSSAASAVQSADRKSLTHVDDPADVLGRPGVEHRFGLPQSLGRAGANGTGPEPGQVRVDLADRRSVEPVQPRTVSRSDRRTSSSVCGVVAWAADGAICSRQHGLRLLERVDGAPDSPFQPSVSSACRRGRRCALVVRFSAPVSESAHPRNRPTSSPMSSTRSMRSNSSSSCWRIIFRRHPPLGLEEKLHRGPPDPLVAHAVDQMDDDRRRHKGPPAIMDQGLTNKSNIGGPLGAIG